MAIFSIVALIGVACVSDTKPTDSPVVSPTALVETDQPPLPTGLVIPTPTSNLPASPQPVDPLCVSQQTPKQWNVSHFAEYPQAVLTFLNSGGSLVALDAALYQDGVASQPVVVAGDDLTGDGKQDVVISIFDPSSQSTPPAGVLLVYVCSAGQYELDYLRSSQKNAGAPGIHYLQDLNKDGKAELVTGEAMCGAHTCFENVQVLAWSGSNFDDRLVGETDDMPYPDIRIQDPDGDGIFTIEVVGSGAGSVGAGPPRGVRREFIYQTGQGSWTPGADILQPSNYRVHVLHDAEAAARNGEYTEALRLYGRVIHDTILDSWGDVKVESENLSAYARFKMIVLYLLQGQSEFARSALQELAESYPSESPQRVFVDLAQAFQEAFNQGGAARGCSAVQSLVLQDKDATLGVLDYGYGNPIYTVDDICPYK